MKPLSYTQLQNKYGGEFVATYKGKVIAHAQNSKELFEKVKDKLGNKDLFVRHVDPKEAVYRLLTFPSWTNEPALVSSQIH